MRRLFGGTGGDGGGRRGTPSDLLVVGLGNPGPEFEGTRHNVGADVVNLLADRAGERLRPAKALHAWVAETRLSNARVALAVPTTYMNESGQAVRPLVARFGVEDIERLVIVHDELDLPPGKLKIKVGGGLAGHNGLRSIQSHLHTADFVRVRIGVGKPPDPRRGADHVLKRPSAKDRATIEASVSRAADAIEILAEAGLSDAMLWANTDQNDGR